MAIPVQIIWSLENGGPSMDEPLDHGTNATQSTLDPQTIFIRHTGDNEITGAAIYMREFIGSTPDGATYTGDASIPTDDFNEIVGWGDETDVSFFGGFQANMDAAGDFPLTNWPDESNKISVSGLGFVVSSGIADIEANAFELKKEMSGTTLGVVDGEVPAGPAPNYRMRMRIQVPASGVTAGTRQFEHILKFTFTS